VASFRGCVKPCKRPLRCSLRQPAQYPIWLTAFAPAHAALQLGYRFAHIVRRMLPIAMHLLQKDGQFLNGHDLFLKRVGASYHAFIEDTEKLCRGKCAEDLTSTTRYVTWSLHTKSRHNLKAMLAKVWVGGSVGTVHADSCRGTWVVTCRRLSWHVGCLPPLASQLSTAPVPEEAHAGAVRDVNAQTETTGCDLAWDAQSSEVLRCVAVVATGQRFMEASNAR
jgi:hypothetical protein